MDGCGRVTEFIVVVVTLINNMIVVFINFFLFLVSISLTKIQLQSSRLKSLLLQRSLKMSHVVF